MEEENIIALSLSLTHTHTLSLKPHTYTYTTTYQEFALDNFLNEWGEGGLDVGPGDALLGRGVGNGALTLLIQGDHTL